LDITEPQEEKFEENLLQLQHHAHIFEKVGGTAMFTYISPGTNKFTYRENFAFHVGRLRRVASILLQNRLLLGLEYLGTFSLWENKKFSFVHTFIELLELIQEVGCSNVGVILDCWHWHCASETQEDIELLIGKNLPIVDVQISDAPVNVPLKLLKPMERELPFSTGIIEIQKFLLAIKRLKYEGSIQVEPFNSSLDEMDLSLSLTKLSQSLQSAVSMLMES